MVKLKLTKLTNEGQSLIEVMMVILLVSVFLTAFASLGVDMVGKLTFGKQQLLAKALLDNDLEDARYDRDTLGWEAFVATMPSCGSPTTSLDYTIERVCAVVSNDAEVTTTVSWPGKQGREHAVSAATILSNENMW